MEGSSIAEIYLCIILSEIHPTEYFAALTMMENIIIEFINKKHFM
jgi:hypothetical protein